MEHIDDIKQKLCVAFGVSDITHIVVVAKHQNFNGRLVIKSLDDSSELLRYLHAGRLAVYDNHQLKLSETLAADYKGRVTHLQFKNSEEVIEVKITVVDEKALERVKKLTMKEASSQPTSPQIVEKTSVKVSQAVKKVVHHFQDAYAAIVLKVCRLFEDARIEDRKNAKAVEKADTRRHDDRIYRRNQELILDEILKSEQKER